MVVNFEIKEANSKHAYGTLSILDGSAVRVYEVFAGSAFLNVATGNALRLRNSGKSFQTVEQVKAHYKKDGAIVAECMKELIALRTAA